jgi:hypothetical protein
VRYGIVKVSTADIRSRPGHQFEMVTQGLLGAVVRITGRAVGDGWLKVELPDGYRGWTRCWNLEILPKARAIDWEQEATAVVLAAGADVVTSRSAGSRRLRDLVLGCRVRAMGRRGAWKRVELPDGVRGWVRSGALGGERPATGAAIVNTARLFLGAPYLWGGVSPKGPDCSGLVQTSYAVHGIRLPRDVKDQRRCGEEVGRDALAAGDLLFFGSGRANLTHVGISTGGPGFIHAGCPVEEASLDPAAANYQRRRAPSLRLARRVLLHP